MSTEPATPHLTQQKLSEKDKAILVDLESWLSQAKFEKKGENVEKCVDERLMEIWALSLCDMDFIKKFTRPLYQIIRVTALSPSIFSARGPPTARDPTSLTPMRILQGNPTISGQDIVERQAEEQGKKAEQGEGAERVRKVLPLAFGWTTYITEEVEMTPALDILVVTSQPLKTG